MKIAVRYYTRSGNSKKLAEAIAEALGTAAQDVSAPLEEKKDAVFLCNAMYAGGVDEQVKTFIAKNKAKIGKLYNVSTAAVAKSTTKQIAKIAQEHGVVLAPEEFSCRGAFTVLHRSRPNDEDLRAAAAFARGIAERR